MYLSIALQYGRSKQVTYVKELLQPLIWTVLDGVVNDEKLDLETDPCIVSSVIVSVFASCSVPTRFIVTGLTSKRCGRE